MKGFFNYIKDDYYANKRYDYKYCINRFITREHENIIWKYQVLLRKEEYYDLKNRKIISLFYRRRKNKLGERLGLTIHKYVFGPGLRIWHYGNIVVSAQARVGKNCWLHGDNCIGNKGKGSDGSAPQIGDNVDIGVGAKIIGGITIADNVTIAAGAVVINSCEEEGVILAGVPAKVIHKKNKAEGEGKK